jgi:alkylhydroperoxidase/carboxymuconolactone decarboxylase family protein YurZ
MSDRIELPGPEELRRRLEDLRRSRGFLLPHHGAMAAALPDLHEAYFVMYRALTLGRRHLDEFEKEFVWMAVLVAVEEAIGTHHLDLFLKAGGTRPMAEGIARLVGYAAAARNLSFMAEHWGPYLPGLDAEASYGAGVEALSSGLGVDPGLVDLALAATNAAVRREAGLRFHVRAAYRRGVPEPKLAEALSLIIWPVGVNHFLDACGAWHDLMATGAVSPSPSFRVWAETPAQGGFDDAAGRRKG